MKHRHNRFAMALALAGAIATVAPEFAPAAEQQIGGTTTRPVLTAPPVPAPVVSTRPLAGPIQLEPSKVKKLSKPAPTPPKVTWYEFTKACNRCTTAYPSATSGFGDKWASFQGHMKACSAKNYSIQDQQAAGCKGSDTLDQCMEKLYDHCMAYAKKLLQSSAPAEIAKAREAAQILEAYAKYVEYTLNTYGK